MGPSEVPVSDLPEAWLRGPVPDLAPFLQPVAHALLQAVEDVRRSSGALSTAHLWSRPRGAPGLPGERGRPRRTAGSGRRARPGLRAPGPPRPRAAPRDPGIGPPRTARSRSPA